ncbi:MAG: hypothetical protein FGM15_02555 [Chthoniobacterales bacterium]|nr:hypothetical protein [Chthoniobacterales bacterium]
MKKFLLLIPLLLAGCITEEDMMAITNPYNRPGQYAGMAPGQRPMTPYQSQSFYQPAYRDGYRQGYNAGYFDGSRGIPYRANSSYRGPAYNVPFSDGYYKGYAEGFHEARRGMAFGCGL